MRVLPSFDHRCHVCGTQFRVRNVFQDAWDEPTGRDPDRCPACDAPLRGPMLVEIGTAKGLLLTLFKVGSYVRDYGDAEAYLRSNTTTEAEVDRFLHLVEAMDYDAWQRDYERSSLAAERKAVVRIRKSAASGELGQRLAGVAATVKGTLRQEHERHMLIFRERKAAQG